ncbi:MAG TPA: DUF1800 domain-containing protein [Pyrinomonadaceae bacterium]|nr:DUF1800 domain-containing protein [Pyrinomonadaceae bacterium]
MQLSLYIIRPVAVLLFVALMVNGFTTVTRAGLDQNGKPSNSLTEEQRITHALNRLGFGARPGDVERVKRIGIQKYIEQQLNPSQVSDEVAEAKVRNLATLTMTTAQLYEKYPQPGQILRQLQRRGELPNDPANPRANQDPQTPPERTIEPEAMPRPEQPNGNPNAAGRNEENRRAIRDYYAERGLLPPQRIMVELQASRILRATYSERQLQEVLVDFWTNHFNVFSGKGADRWLLVSYDRDTIRPHTLGKFHDLLLATAQSPAMLFYLDNFQSVSPNMQVAQRRRQDNGSAAGLFDFGRGTRRGLRRDQSQPGRNPGAAPEPAALPQPPASARLQRRGINENYARELMELHTLGVDGGYTQKDVQEVARCFTGWTIFAPRGGGAAGAMMNQRRAEMLRENAGRFFFNQRAHDDGEKTVLGHKIPAGGGIEDGLRVLDILAHHPATAKFIASKLTRYFVSDTPPPALVDRVAAAFTKSDGDISETLRAIFFSPEFNSPAAYRAKVKRPFELAISSLRTLGAETSGGPQLHQWIARMGEPLYGFQTPNGYSDSAESWVNTGGLLERLNFALALASNRIPGTRVDLKRFAGNGAGGANVAKEKTMDQFLELIVGGDVSPKTRDLLLRQLEQEVVITPAPARSQMAADESDGIVEPPRAMPGEMARERSEIPAGPESRGRGRPLARLEASITDPVTKIVGLILGSPEFQRQ